MKLIIKGTKKEIFNILNKLKEKKIDCGGEPSGVISGVAMETYFENDKKVDETKPDLSKQIELENQYNNKCLESAWLALDEQLKLPSPDADVLREIKMVISCLTYHQY